MGEQYSRGADASPTSPRVADRVEHVADEAAAADAFDRALGEQGAERGVIQRRQLSQCRAAQGVARMQGRFLGDGRELVPGADGETIITAVDAVAERLTEFQRDWPGVLDGQVGDTAARIELIGREEGARRADVQAERDEPPQMVALGRIRGQRQGR